LKNAESYELQDGQRNANMYRMIKATRGKAQINKSERGRSRLVPSKAAIPARRPDFLGRLKKLYRGKALKVAGAELVSRDRDRD
jgi:hypothetical protein